MDDRPGETPLVRQRDRLLRHPKFIHGEALEALLELLWAQPPVGHFDEQGALLHPGDAALVVQLQGVPLLQAPVVGRCALEGLARVNVKPVPDPRPLSSNFAENRAYPFSGPARTLVNTLRIQALVNCSSRIN